jgi:hypothetical protein
MREPATDSAARDSLPNSSLLGHTRFNEPSSSIFGTTAGTYWLLRSVLVLSSAKIIEELRRKP